jgi:transcription elongation GreA/GreB family factor
VDIRSEEGRKLLLAESRHGDLAEQAERDRRERRLDELERKEAALNKLIELRQVKVSLAARACVFAPATWALTSG